MNVSAVEFIIKEVFLPIYIPLFVTIGITLLLIIGFRRLTGL